MQLRALRNLAAVVLLAGGCTMNAMAPPAVAPPPESVRHTDYASLLGRYVALDGRVDYAAWKKSPEDVATLERYVERLLEHPPHVSPARYADDTERLAYWLNLYNSLVQREILAHWPMDMIDPRAFMSAHTFVVGGRHMSLADIEARIINTTFADPRAHFAISCGSVSCPLLPSTPYDGISLDRRLDDAARAFINRESNVRVDHDNKRIVLSALFGWYRADFIRLVKSRGTHPAPELIDLLAMYAADPLDKAIERARKGRYRIELMPYDWRVNHIGSLVERPKPSQVMTASGPFPDLALERLDGTKLSIADLRGKVVLVDFWATWCKPCLWSFPHYAELQLAHEKQGLVIVAIAQDERPEPVAAFAKANNIAIEIALEPKHQAAEAPLGVDTLPTIILIDREGVMRYRHEGYAAAGFAGIEEKLGELLTEPTPDG